jgi:hypothetical protein
MSMEEAAMSALSIIHREASWRFRKVPCYAGDRSSTRQANMARSLERLVARDSVRVA